MAFAEASELRECAFQSQQETPRILDPITERNICPSVTARSFSILNCDA